ncbi:MAG: hypothetical protein HQ465_25615 [Rhodospirillales bacterium]|nr:hypothetical protein [Rhodospirillales bacterium]
MALIGDHFTRTKRSRMPGPPFKVESIDLGDATPPREPSEQGTRLIARPLVYNERKAA